MEPSLPSESESGTASRRGKRATDRLAFQRERDRLAQLLHDTVCQELTGICFMASAAAHQHETANVQVGKQFEEIADQIQRTGKQLAKIVHALRDQA